MACSNPSATNEFARLDASAPASEAVDSAEHEKAARNELKSLFRELVGLVDCLWVEEAAHHAESDAAARVREAREALEKSLASHGLLGIPATNVSPGHRRPESIRATKRFIASSGACRNSDPAKRSESLKATLMFGKR